MNAEKKWSEPTTGSSGKAAPVHPKGKAATVLLSSVFGPYAGDDEYGSRAVNPMELYHNQVTRAQGPFSIRGFVRSWGLKMIQENISAPCVLLDFPALDTFEDEIRRNSYDIVGISSILVNIGKVRKMCELVRRHLPEAVIVVGGHISGLADLPERIDADHIVRGEGIRWFRSFLGEDVNRPVRHVRARSAIWSRALGGDVPDSKLPAILIPSVGCPLGCNFCSTSAMFGGKGGGVEFISSGDELFQTMCDLERALNTKDFFVMDENFLLRRERTMRLLELMEMHGKDWGLSVFASANAIRSYSPDEWVRLGLTRIWIGLEGENSRYGKLARSDTQSLVRELQSHGISVLGSSIIGLEAHAPENVSKAIDYAVGHDADLQQFMLYTPLPGTPLYSQLAKEGKLLSPEEAPWPEWHGQRQLVHRHAHIGVHEAKKYLDQAFCRDYEVNGPSVLRGIRTNIAGWKRYGNDPRPLVRQRYQRRAASLATVQAGALWAGLRYCRGSAAIEQRLNSWLRDIYAAFGIKARIAAPVFGLAILRRLRKEARFLEQGRTYEPTTIRETNCEHARIPSCKPASARMPMATGNRWTRPVPVRPRMASTACD